MLHELGYDVTEQPSLHFSEQRRLVEGKVKYEKMQSRKGKSSERQRIKERSKDRARRRFTESR